MPAAVDLAIAGEASSPLACSPMPLEKLMDSVQDTATKRDIKAVLDSVHQREVANFNAAGRPLHSAGQHGYAGITTYVRSADT